LLYCLPAHSLTVSDTADELAAILRWVNVSVKRSLGPVVVVRAGDIVVIPAGVGRKNEGASKDLLVVGA